MTSEAAAKAVFEALVAAGLKRDRSAGGSARFVGPILVNGREVAVGVDFPSLDFVELPRVTLMDRRRDLPGAVAHIQAGDRLCYAAPGSIVLDRYDPGGAALTVLELARRTLAEVTCDAAAEAVAAEFVQHWLGELVCMDLPVGAGPGDAELFVLPRSGDRELMVLARGMEVLDRFGAGSRSAALARRHRAWIALTDRPLYLPRGMLQPTTLAEFVEWGNAVEPGLGQRLLGAAQTFYRQVANLFVRAPNGCVGAALLLPPDLAQAAQRPAGHARIVDRHRARIKLVRYAVSRMDADFMFQRNLGGEPGLSGKRIVLVGLGTIGGHMAKFLAQSGAGHGPGELVLIDPDIFAPGNVGRHWLHPNQIGAPKALACRDELRTMFPSSRIFGIVDSVLGHMDWLERADLVVDATGEEAVSVALNEALIRGRGATNAPAALHVWLVGNGAAAQAMLVHGTAAGACLKCVRSAEWVGGRLWPLAPSNGAAMVPVTCGEDAFLPYGVAAPAIAAGLAMKMVLDWAKGEPEPLFRTLRVDAAATVGVPDESPPPRPECPACGAGVR